MSSATYCNCTCIEGKGQGGTVVGGMLDENVRF